MLESEIQFVNKSRACSLAANFQIGEDLKQIVLRALLPNDLRRCAISTAGRANLPIEHRLRDSCDDRLAGVAANRAALDPCPARARPDSEALQREFLFPQWKAPELRVNVRQSRA